VSGVSNRARVYRCGIAIREDGVDAVVFDLPGGQTQVPQRDDALAVLPVVIAEHLAWLGGHGQVTRDAFPFAVEVGEEVDVPSLAGVSSADLAARFEKSQPWQTRGAEHWTVRKALRRAIGHERFHSREVEQRLAWLLLGAPEVSPAAGRSKERGMVPS
jgi:hypothetical protein